MFGFLGTILKTVAKVAGVDSVTNAVETIKNTISSNDELANELRKLEIEEKKLLLEEARSIHDLYKTEIASDDPFVRRARPALLWLVFGLLTVNFGILPIANTIAAFAGWTPIEITIPPLPTELYALIGTIVSVYIGARSWDKKNKAGGR